MDSTRAYSGIKSAWLMPLRLITFSLIFGIIVGWLGYPSYLRGPFLAYCFIALASFSTILFLGRWKVYFLFHFLIALYFITEILCEAGIVYTTGSLYSPFAALFLLTIVSAALIYRLVGTLVVASLVSLAYASVTWVNASIARPGGQVLPSGGILFSTDDTFFYSTFLHILIFYLVAFIAGYLAQKLQSKDKELQSASVELIKARLETDDILYHLNSGLLTVDRRGKVIYFNRAAETILGLRESEVAGQNCRQVFSGRLTALADHLSSVLESRQRLMRSEIEINDNEGETVPVGISTSLLFDENNNIRGLIAIFQDITDAKILEERMRQADCMAAVGELSAYIAHEIRNPLASISGSVEVLKNDLVLEGDNEKLMSLIIKETSRLNKILSDFLLYARVGRTQIRKVELNRTILDTIEVIRQHPSFNENIKIGFHSENSIVYISGDEDQLKQLILNLAVNACDALGKNGGLIEFEVKTTSDIGKKEEICLIVRDNGPGIPQKQTDKVFLPFYSNKKGGTGLGLAIVSRLMETHNGRVELSSPPGKGAEFRLYFRGIGEESIDRKPVPAVPVSFSQ